MPVPVIPLRFVNTPTIGELYAQEAKGEDLGVAQEDVDDLSDEYNKVDGNEAYYQLMFKYLPDPYRNLDSITGSEGLFSWVKDVVMSLIEQVKRFFKWVFSFFTSKQKIAENKLEGFEKDLAQNGIKDNPITYPETANVLWGKEANLPNNLNWVNEAVKRIKANIKKADEFADLMENFTLRSSDLFMPSKVSEQATKVYLNNYRKSIAKIFTSSEQFDKAVYFEGGMDVIVSEKGPVKFQANQKVAKKRNASTFNTDLTQVKSLHKEIDELSSEDLRKLINRITGLETNYIKMLEKTMSFAEQVSIGEQEAEMKKVVRLVTGFLTESMTTLKAIETICYRSTSAGLGLLQACIKKD